MFSGASLVVAMQCSNGSRFNKRASFFWTHNVNGQKVNGANQGLGASPTRCTQVQALSE